MNECQSPLKQRERLGQSVAGRLLEMLTRPFWICVLLAVVTMAVYWPAIGFDYVNYDDPEFITTNSHVLGGLTWENARWAFDTELDGNWIPLTWLSYMFDVEWSGYTATGLHLTNILLHSANTVLVFLLFWELTGMHWQSAVLASLFGLHPLHVESVAWVAERKDVLSTLFGLLALLMYIAYARRVVVHSSHSDGNISGPTSLAIPPAADVPSGRVAGSKLWSREYFGALIFFALGLMCKPMLVSLPFVMLLLDYWPLQRLEPERLFSQRATWVRLICEKIPFFALAAADATVTFFGQLRTASLEPLADRPISARIANAFVSYMRYLGKTFWPVDLANPYPLQRHWPVVLVVAAVVLVLGLSIAALLMARKRPYGLVGWLWFLGTLIPVIGLVQAGFQSMADRYTYIPLLGVFWIIVWAGAEQISRWRLPGTVVALAVLLILGTLTVLTRRQLNYWQNGELLFRHAVALTKNNFIALDGLGRALFNEGRMDEAVFYELKALEIQPRYPTALEHLSETLARIEAARATGNNPRAPAPRPGTDYADAHYVLGRGLAMDGKLGEAVQHFQKALLYEPDNVNIRNGLGYALFFQGRLPEALRQGERVLQLSPYNPQAHYILGLVFLKQGKLDKAVASLRKALQFGPDFPEAHDYLGQALAMLGQRDEAIAQFKEALRLNPNDQDARDRLNKLEGLSR